jgi:hypothetical protein
MTISADEPARVKVEGVLRVKARGKPARDYRFKSVRTRVAPGKQRHLTLRLKSRRRCAARLKDLSGSHKIVWGFGTTTFTDASGVTTAPQWNVVPKRLSADDRAKLRRGKGSC